MNEKKYYILENVISIEECSFLYNRLLKATSWSLTRTSTGYNQTLGQFGAFPGLIVEHDEKVLDNFLSGYFRAITYRIKQLVKLEDNGVLPEKIKRIHLGAKNIFSKTEFHKDSLNENAWTILGFINPFWSQEDGGEFYIENKKIDYKPARFVVFKSNLSHNSGQISNDQLKDWRISLNIVLLDK